MSLDSKNELISLRKSLHSHPEIAFQEKNTALKIEEFLTALNPDEIITGIGGTGILACFRGKNTGKSVAFRAELDALPISEINSFEHSSENDGKGHLCGHDGHMAIVLGLASEVSKSRPESGETWFLFQPAEEIGAGSQAMLADSKMKDLHFDYIFALHNLPGCILGQIQLKKEVFSAASVGVKVFLEGKTSHAAHPSSGKSPAMCMAKILEALVDFPNSEDPENFQLITPIHAKLGKEAFGTSPGEAVVMATLRTFSNEKLIELKSLVQTISTEIANKHEFYPKFEWVEEFAVTLNEESAFNFVEASAKANNFEISIMETPFRWSEDFGQFSAKANCCMFGLGSGINHPQLHNPDYDFPDSIIPIGINMFLGILEEINP
ncbi:MAG: amidohydrolase [Sphingobacteriales bacterium]|jgi:amidohydrolase